LASDLSPPHSSLEAERLISLEKNRQLSEEVSSLSSSKSSLTNEIFVLSPRCSDLERQRCREISSLSADIWAPKSTQSSVEAELSSLQESHLQLQLEKDESISKLFSPFAEIASLQQTRLSLEAEICRADSELLSSKSTLSDLAASSFNLEEEIARLQSERGTLTEQLEEHKNTVAVLKEKVAQLKEVEWGLHRNCKRARKEGVKTKTQILALMRIACPTALEHVPEDYDLVWAVNEFLQTFPIQILARATTMFNQKMNCVHQSVDDAMARIMELVPKLKFAVQLFGQYDTQIGEMTNLIDASLPCTTVAAALEKILGRKPNPQMAADQLHVQQLFGQVQKRMKDVTSKHSKLPKSLAMTSARTTQVRRP
jgi:DNA repair exonuclease SbcCD ATPase subunit